MASPRAITSIGRLAPRSPQCLQNIRHLSSLKTPVDIKTTCRVSLFNIDTPNRMRIVNNGLSNCFQNVLGSGSFGKVIQAAYKGDQVAAKILRRRRDSDNSVNGERHATSLRHDNIIRILGIEQGPAASMITMELCGKSLQEKLDEGPLYSKDRIEIFIAIACALRFCHCAGVVHADVKPKNILMAGDGKPKLADFGSSVLLGEVNVVGGIRGTPGYVAPEVIRGELPGPLSDVYSLGVSAWQMLSGIVPFAELHPHTILYLTGKGVKPEDEGLDDDFGGRYKSLYRNMLSFATADRSGIDAVISGLESLEREV
ncbi:serine/threonine-protein kinase mos [Athalia rosae]|uniref:non-specific serine/threonine protein kinase n=1 Tax=Athalia rosae TaxID=37344 RepID=Q4R2X5_ATHRO|nr:serine/threonine-protein kinase mos [Athalia rosae]BAE02658.1 Mos [Athalia rosae]BAE02659.1 Mos [Athalia rosae]